MMFDPFTAELGSVEVLTTNNRGSTPEELAERALDKIIYVGSNAHPAIRDQAEAFKDSIRAVLVQYLKEAVRANTVTLENRFCKTGNSELIPLLHIEE